MSVENCAVTVYATSNTGKPLCYSCAHYRGPYQKCVNSENLGSSTFCYTCQFYKKANCDRCDGPGGIKTFSNQVCMPINGKVQCVDWCIHQIVAALNAGGVGTIASCCGHKTMPGRIDLEDGRVLCILNSADEWEKYESGWTIDELRAAIEGKEVI